DRHRAEGRDLRVVVGCVELEKRGESIDRVPESRDQPEKEQDRGEPRRARGPSARCLGRVCAGFRHGRSLRSLSDGVHQDMSGPADAASLWMPGRPHHFTAPRWNNLYSIKAIPQGGEALPGHEPRQGMENTRNPKPEIRNK